MLIVLWLGWTAVKTFLAFLIKLGSQQTLPCILHSFFFAFISVCICVLSAFSMLTISASWSSHLLGLGSGTTLDLWTCWLSGYSMSPSVRSNKCEARSLLPQALKAKGSASVVALSSSLSHTEEPNGMYSDAFHLSPTVAPGLSWCCWGMRNSRECLSPVDTSAAHSSQAIASGWGFAGLCRPRVPSWLFWAVAPTAVVWGRQAQFRSTGELNSYWANFD